MDMEQVMLKSFWVLCVRSFTLFFSVSHILDLYLACFCLWKGKSKNVVSDFVNCISKKIILVCHLTEKIYGANFTELIINLNLKKPLTDLTGIFSILAVSHRFQGPIL